MGVNIRKLIGEAVNNYVVGKHSGTAFRAYKLVQELYRMENHKIFEDKDRKKEIGDLLNDLQEMVNFFDSHKR